MKKRLGGLTAVWIFGGGLLLALLLVRGPALWDGGLVSLAAIAESPPASLPPARTTWGACRLGHVHGRGLLLAGDPAAALPYLQTGVTCEPHRWAWFDLGRAQLALGQTDAAAQSWQTAVAYDHVARLAQQARQAEDTESSLAYWRLAAQVEPQNPQPSVQIGQLLLATDPAQAEAMFRQALALDPDDAPANYALGNFYVRQKQDVAGALPYLEQAHQNAPQNIQYLTVLARQTGTIDPQQARVYWLRLAETSERSRPNAMHNLGNLALRQGDLAAAQQYQQQAVAAQPQNGAYWRGLAQVYEAAGCPVEAVAAYEAVLARQPGERLAAEVSANLTALQVALAQGTEDCPLPQIEK